MTAPSNTDGVTWPTDPTLWRSTPPPVPGAWLMRCDETPEPDVVPVVVERGRLVAHADIGSMPVAMLHNGVTNCQWLQPACCDHCDDGSGKSFYPHYGVAAHVHTAPTSEADRAEGGTSTHPLPAAMWGSNFRPDPDSPGLGEHLRCPICGAGEKA